MKARLGPKRLSHKEAMAMTQNALEVVAPAVVGAVLYILYRRGWHKDKLVTLYKEIVNFFMYPQAFDRYLTDIEIKDYLSEKLGIDWQEIIDAVKVEDE
jgi:DNA-binding GntR family transcriptional regulator